MNDCLVEGSLLVPRDNQSNCIRNFRRDVIRERYRIPCWTLPIHGVWTAVVMNVLLWVLLITLFAGFELLYVLFTLFDLRRLNLRTIVDTYGILTAVIAGIFAAATFPMCVVSALVNARPRLILAGRGKLVVRYCKKRMVAPLSECQWKPGQVWSMDNVGALWRREPFLVLTWTPIQSSGNRQPYSRSMFIGLTPSAYRQWLRLIVREQIPRYSWAVSLYCIFGLVSGAFIGRLLGAAVNPMLQMMFGRNLAFSIEFLLVFDGLAIGGIGTYVNCGELRRVRAYIHHQIQSPRLMMAMCFAAVAVKPLMWLGLLVVVVGTILNGSLGFVFGWYLQRTAERRSDDAESTVHVSTADVLVGER